MIRSGESRRCADRRAIRPHPGRWRLRLGRATSSESARALRPPEFALRFRRRTKAPPHSAGSRAQPEPGLGGSLEANPITGATLELSLGGRADLGADARDRILVRAYHAGRWIYLGAVDVKGEFSNAKRGDYLSFNLADIGAWSDLSDLKVVVEYTRESGENSSVYVDGLWVNVRYENDGLSGSSPEDLALSAQNIRSALSAKDAQDRKVRRDLLTTPEGSQIAFTHVDEHPDAKIIMKSDRALYHCHW